MLYIKKILPVFLLCLSVLSCELPIDTDNSEINNELAVIRVGITGMSSRSIMPVYPDLGNMVYDLYGSSSSSRDETFLYGFFDLVDTEFALKPGTWDFTLKAYENVNGVYYHVLTAERKGVVLSSGDVQIINFNLKPINNPVINGYAYVYIEFPYDNLINNVEVFLDGEIYDNDDALIYLGGHYFEYMDELPPGDYHISFIFKDINNLIISVVSEILVIRSGAESWNEYYLDVNDINGIPADPLNFYALTYNSSTGIMVFQWEDNSFNETGFIFYDEFNDEEHWIPAGSTGFNLNIGAGLTNNELTGRSYYLYAWNDFGCSNEAEYLLVVPSVPTGLSAESLSSSSIRIVWNQVPGASSYNIYRSAASTGIFTSIGTSTSLSYTDTLLSANTVYFYKVTASGILGTSVQSNFISEYTKLNAPAGVQANVATITSITVSWNSVTGANSYRVYRSTSSDGVYTLVGSPNSTSFTDTGLNASTPYYYKVAGFNANGEGELSSYVTRTIVVYTVSFNANGGTGTQPASQTVLAGSAITLPSGNSLSLLAHSLYYWNTNSTGTGTDYSINSSYTVNANVILYAKWVKSAYIITFNANGGTGTVPSQVIVNFGSQVQLPGGGGLSMLGHTFAGWNTNSSGTGINFNEFSFFIPLDDMTLYARWTTTASGVTIIFDKNDDFGGWQKIYNPSNLFNGQRITQGDVYAFNYSFVSNTYIDVLYVYLVDNCEAIGWGWEYLSNNVTISYDIYSGYLYSGTAYFIANSTATNSTPEANRLVFQTGDNTYSQPTLTFTKLEIVKDTSGYIPLSLNEFIQNYLPAGTIHSYRIYLTAGWYYICWEDVDTDSYYFSGDVKVGLRREGFSSYIVPVTDTSNVTGYQNEIDIYISNTDYYIIEVHGFNNTSAGTYGLIAY